MPRSQRTLAVLDLETDPFEAGLVPVPFCAGFYDGLDFQYWWGDNCVDRLIDHLRDGNYLVYAHNGGKFDFFYLLPFLERKRIKVINGRISKANVGKSELRDSFNILPIPLSEYKKDEIDYNKFTRANRHKHATEIIKYLEGDCKYLYELVDAFIARFDRKLTVASAAMAEMVVSVKKTTDRPIIPFYKAQDEQFRKYYYGGRCEAFASGHIKGKYKIVDINSAYSYAMVHNHPDPTFPLFRTSKFIPKQDCYFASIEAISKGALPFRDDKGRLTFPADDVVRHYDVTGWEIKAGLDTETLKIKKIHVIWVPQKTINFNDYVNRFYLEKKTSKENGDRVSELFAKLMLNSAYGKYSINPEKFKDWIIVDVGDIPEGGIYDNEHHQENDKEHWRLNACWPEYNIDVYEKPAPSETGYINVAVGASITGFVRAYLWRAICDSSGVIYCDTDSVCCIGFNGAIGDELGQWKLEATASQCFIAGKKLYAFYTGNKKGAVVLTDDEKGAKGNYKNWKLASKGVRLTPQDIIEVALGGAVSWSKQAPTFSLKMGARFIKREIKKTI